MKTFDKEHVYDDEIAPLMTKIIAICRRENIPMVASFLYAKDEDENHLCTTLLPGPDDEPHPTFQLVAKLIRDGMPALSPLLAMTITAPKE